jgi:hypothetical protein
MGCTISPQTIIIIMQGDAGSWIWFAFAFASGLSGIMGDNDHTGNLFQSFVRSTINR